eukprot:CFRG3544T1
MRVSSWSPPGLRLPLVVLVVLLLLSITSVSAHGHSHGHSHDHAHGENPARKYSRGANEDIDDGHVHNGHSHAHTHEDDYNELKLDEIQQQLQEKEKRMHRESEFAGQDLLKQQDLDLKKSKDTLTREEKLHQQVEHAVHNQDIHAKANAQEKLNVEDKLESEADPLAKDATDERVAVRSNELVWKSAMSATAIVCIAPVFILPLVPIDSTAESTRLLNVLLAFASGGLLGDVFLHLLPHALFPHSHGDADEHSADDHEHQHDHSHSTIVGLWVLFGFMSFFLIEKLMRGSGQAGHGHSHDVPIEKSAEQSTTDSLTELRDRRSQSINRSISTEDKEAEIEQKPVIAVAAYLNLVADFSHNFTDGMAIGAAYLANDALGFSTMLAILFHEIPHEIGDYAILIRSGFSRKDAMLAQFSTAIGAMLGTVVGLIAKDLLESSAWILPLTAGGFIYIATTTVIPDLLKESSVGQTFLEMLAMSVGVLLMVIIAEFE